MSDTEVDANLQREVLRAAQQVRVELKELVELARTINPEDLETKDLEAINENMTALQLSLEAFTAWINETKQTP